MHGLPTSAYTQSNFDCNFTINSCSNESSYWGIIDPPDMVENYMDYSNDTCMNSFTQGQKDRMVSFLNTDRVSLLSSNGCGNFNCCDTILCNPGTSCDSITCTCTCDSISSVNDLFYELNSKIHIYPVPSSGKVNMMINSAIKDFYIEITNIFGQPVGSISCKNNLQRTFSFDLNNMPAGLYFVKINSMNGSIVKKFLLE
ncbi:MAG: zinc-dependent metalloprotease [Bacteroidota bacterium]